MNYAFHVLKPFKYKMHVHLTWNPWRFIWKR